MGQVEKTLGNATRCICVKCPSYTLGCMLRGIPDNLKAVAGGLGKAEHMEGMFCAFEKSSCISQDKGCLCHNCPLYKANGLDKASYCLETGGR